MVGLALNGAASLMPSLRAILYKVLEGMPNAFEALFADIVPVRNASSALFKLSSLHDLVGPSFLGVSIPSRCALCQRVVEGIPNVARTIAITGLNRRTLRNLLKEFVFAVRLAVRGKAK